MSVERNVHNRVIGEVPAWAVLFFGTCIYSSKYNVLDSYNRKYSITVSWRTDVNLPVEVTFAW